MIKKVLIAEDHESANISLQKTLEELSISAIEYVYYCDDALQKVQVAKHRNETYDLLITDLSFEDDGRAQKLTGGAALITAARQVQPDLKVLVFSAENRAAVIEDLFDKYGIDGYVRKARHDARELKEAIAVIDRHERYFPRHLALQLKQKNTHEFTDYDIAVITLMAHGIRQKDIPTHLEQQKIRPSGLSSLEKRLGLIKQVLSFSNNEQLVAYCKEIGIV